MDPQLVALLQGLGPFGAIAGLVIVLWLRGGIVVKLDADTAKALGEAVDCKAELSKLSAKVHELVVQSAIHEERHRSRTTLPDASSSGRYPGIPGP